MHNTLYLKVQDQHTCADPSSLLELKQLYCTEFNEPDRAACTARTYALEPQVRAYRYKQRRTAPLMRSQHDLSILS
jgi:hypothetical protein